MGVSVAGGSRLRQWKPRTRHTLFLRGLCGLCVSLLYFPGEASAQPVYKCRQPDGRITYQAEKCAHGSSQSEVAPPPPPISGGGPVTREPAVTDKELEYVVGILTAYEGCSAYVPGFAAKNQAAFSQWKQRNLAAMVQYSQDGAAQRKVRESVEYSQKQARQASAEERKYQAETCDEMVASWLKTPTTPNKTP